MCLIIITSVSKLLYYLLVVPIIYILVIKCGSNTNNYAINLGLHKSSLSGAHCALYIILYYVNK